MLPGAAARLYKDEQITIQIQPLAKWCNAEYIEKRVQRVVSKENKIIFEDQSTLEYDLAALNVGSRTRGANDTPGVWDNSLTTRPINDLLGKIEKRERELIEAKATPEIVVCGGGAAGVELAFAFKRRWEDLLKKEIQVTIVTADNELIRGGDAFLRQEVIKTLNEKKVKVIYNAQVAQITKEAVHLKDGRVLESNVALWATGAEAQKVIANSDVDILHSYFKVNDHMQIPSVPNVFAGGDCVTM